jgi:hypothetical protein
MLIWFLLAWTIAPGARWLPALAAERNDPQPPGEPSPGEKLDASRQAPGQGISAMNTADLFGYAFNTQSPAWVEIRTTGQEVDFSTRDDDYDGPFQIGFHFKFYEYSYPELYISTNGLISFGDGSDEFENRTAPRDTYPNNIIAPFWDDLILLVDSGGQRISHAYYQAFNGPGQKFFVVEWYRIARLGSQDTLTFQAILYENGDLVFQYQELAGELDQATVGIEDGDGVDGKQYLYNAPGLNTATAIKFTRPPQTARTKVLPVYQSGFAYHGVNRFTLTIRNTGEQGPDGYNLTFTKDNPAWQINLYEGDGITRLHDHNSDSLADSGQIAQGEEAEVVLEVKTSPVTPPGSFVKVALTATSWLDPSRQATMSLQAAVPAPFAQAILDISIGMRLQLSWKENQIMSPVSSEQFTGSNLSVSQIAAGGYLFAWEQNERNNQNISYSNLKYRLYNQFGQAGEDISLLTNNEAATVKTEDHFLVTDALPGGRIGALWVRIKTQSFFENGQMVQKSNQNMFLEILNSAGQVVRSETNLTNNNNWRGKNDLNIPTFLYPRIAGTSDNHFVVAWVDDRLQSGGSTDDLVYAVFDQDGNPILPLTTYTQSIPNGIRYNAPSLVPLSNQKTLMAYVTFDPGVPEDPHDDTAMTTFLVMNSVGSILKNQTTLSNDTGSTPDGLQLANGNVLVGWNVPGLNQIHYALLDGSSFNLLVGPNALDTPKGREPGVVSVTRDGTGGAVLTWGDAEQSDYLCYALLNATGNVVTPPMITYTGSEVNPTINTNSHGLGNAPYDGTWLGFLPVNVR